MRLLTSPWVSEFDRFMGTVRSELLLAARYITRGPLKRAASIMPQLDTIQVRVLTKFEVDGLAAGANDPEALAEFCNRALRSEVWHLPGLHAKVLIADRRQAVVTSSNLTDGGLSQNHEYGVLIDEIEVVLAVARDIDAYASLGVRVPLSDLAGLAELTGSLRKERERLMGSAPAKRVREFERYWQAARETLLMLRARPGESTTSIFARTVLYLLQQKPLTTQELHPLVQGIHPDLCDNTEDRVINGVHFGKRWKHMVRNAQQTLKGRGLITQDSEGRWRLAV